MLASILHIYGKVIDSTSQIPRSIGVTRSAVSGQNIVLTGIMVRLYDQHCLCVKALTGILKAAIHLSAICESVVLFGRAFHLLYACLAVFGSRAYSLAQYQLFY